MKRFHYVFLAFTIAWFVLLQFYPWWSMVLVGLAMLLTAYYFYRTRWEGTESRNRSMQKEIGELQLQLDSSILKENKASKEAETAKRLKRQLLATITHGIRTPMNGMLGLTLLLRNTALTNEQREYIDKIAHCGENLLGTVNGMLICDRMNPKKACNRIPGLHVVEFKDAN